MKKDLYAILDDTPTIENAIIINQLYQDLKRIMSTLSVEQKEIIILKIYLNMPHKEIAKLNNISIITSMERLRYAIINVRKIIENNKMVLTN